MGSMRGRWVSDICNSMYIGGPYHGYPCHKGIADEQCFSVFGGFDSSGSTMQGSPGSIIGLKV